MGQTLSEPMVEKVSDFRSNLLSPYLLLAQWVIVFSRIKPPEDAVRGKMCQLIIIIGRNLTMAKMIESRMVSPLCRVGGLAWKMHILPS